MASTRLTDSLNACVHNIGFEHVCVRDMSTLFNMQCRKCEWLFTHVHCTLKGHVTTYSLLFQHSPAVKTAFGASSKTPAPRNIKNACATTKSNRYPGACPRVFLTAISSNELAIRSIRQAHPVECATTLSIQAIARQGVAARLHSEQAVWFASQQHWLKTLTVAPTMSVVGMPQNCWHPM